MKFKREDINMNRMIILIIGTEHYRSSDVIYCALSKVFLNKFIGCSDVDYYDDYSIQMVYDDECVHHFTAYNLTELEECIIKCKDIIRRELRTKPWKKAKK